MRIKKILLSILPFLPALIIMLMIFGFSSENSSESTSTSVSFTKTIVSTIDHAFNLSYSEEKIDYIVTAIEHFVRKSAHFTEYLLLSISLVIPLLFKGIKGIKNIFISEIICIIYASTDEFHQLFISGRSASFFDVFIDSLGAFTGIILVFVIIFLRQKLHKT